MAYLQIRFIGAALSNGWLANGLVGVLGLGRQFHLIGICYWGRLTVRLP